jgi:antitoxin CptB
MQAAATILAAERRRLRWRARRGLLENDLLITRFLDRHEDRLSDEDVAAFDLLLDLSDNELLDLLLERTAVPATIDTLPMRSLLARLRTS